MLRSVRSFVAVADLGGFRKAAEALLMSQPSLSANVRELEHQLGMRLMRRTKRNIQLTEIGKLFLARVRRTLDDFETIIVEIKEKATIQRGRAIVASVPSIAANALPNILATFMKEHPGIVVHVCDERTEVIEMVRQPQAGAIQPVKVRSK